MNILTRFKQFIFWPSLGCFWLLFFFVSPVAAQSNEAITLTIAPPLIKVNMVPGDVLKSSVRLVNNNVTPVSIYVDKLDFKSSEDGGIQFIQKDELKASGTKFLLSQWLEFDPGPFEIAAQQSLEIPFTINLPTTAEPGGHYAAILAGSKPIGKTSGSGIKISSLLASLIMLEVKGNIEERGQVREFSVSQKIYNQPRVDFTVRFANTGNIHLQPRGEIKIYDMFGHDKGSVTINHSTEYGNVLPDSSRQWNFSWEGLKKLSEMGRYKAVLILTYGNQAPETISQTVYFWLIYPKPLLLILGGTILLVLLIVFSLRFYIRRAIIKTTTEIGYIAPKMKNETKISVIPDDKNGQNYQTAIASKKIKK